MIFYNRFYNKNIELLINHSIDVDVKSIIGYKSALILNDTIAIFKECPRLFTINQKHYYKDYYRYIESLKEPYHLSKKENSDTIVIVKSKDTLFYKLTPF
jgi:hypothetical protein